MSQMKAYMQAKFKNNGAIEGSPRVKKVGSIDVSKMIECFQVDHVITAPRDHNSGHSVGRRVHGLFTVAYEVRNAGAVLLLNALCTNDMFDEIKFYFFDTNEKGESYELYNLTLSGGTVGAIETHLPNVNERGTDKEMPFYHTASFSYAKIEGSNWAKKSFIDHWENIK